MKPGLDEMECRGKMKRAVLARIIFVYLELKMLMEGIKFIILLFKRIKTSLFIPGYAAML